MKRENHHYKKNSAILFLLATIGIVLFSIINIRPIFWVDEGYSIRFVYCTFSEIWSMTGKDVHPPLYYFILKIYSCIFGDSVITLRFCSTLAVIGLMILGCIPIRRTFGDKTSIFFILLVILLPFMQYCASEIRMYSWLMLFVTCTGFFAYLWATTKKLKQWIFFSLFVLFSCYTHNYGVLATATIYAILLGYILLKEKTLFKYWLISSLVVAALYSPWLIVLLNQATRIKGSYWIDIPSLWNIGLSMYYPIHMKTWVTWDPKFIVAESAILILWIYFIYNAYKNRSKFTAMWTACCLCFLTYFVVLCVSLLISYTYMPIFVDKYLTGTLGIFMLGLALAMAIADYKQTINKIALGSLILFTITASVYRMYSDREYHVASGKNYEEISQYLKEKIESDDAILNINESFVLSGMYSAMYPHNRSYILTDDDFEKHHATEHYKLSHIHALDQISDQYDHVYLISQNKNADHMKNSQDSVAITKRYDITDKYEGESVVIYQLKNRTNGR